MQRRKGEKGQAGVLIVLAMSVFLLGALGLAIDGSHLYAQRQTAQAAADGAAQAGIMSIFDGTSGAWGGYTGTPTAGTAIPCTSSGMNTAAACEYAQSNGFALSEVSVIPNPTVSVSNLSTSDTVNLLQVNVTRSVRTLLMWIVGTPGQSVTATATAGILQQKEPVPIIITHPTMAGALNLNGTTGITITGGPQRSIQVNSNGTSPAGAAYSGPSSGTVNLSGAGPHNTGGDFATFGGPAGTSCATPPTTCNHVQLGSTSHYIDPASPIPDPLASITPPSQPTTTPPQSGQSCNTLHHCGGCPGGASSCTEYLPGLYSSGISITTGTVMFDPGIYYIQSGGFSTKNVTAVGMCGTACTPDSTTKDGMLVYDTGPLTAGCDNTGGFDIDTNSNDVFYGAGVSASNLTGAPASPYYGILFFEDRNACGHNGPGTTSHGGPHTLGQGNGCFSIVGTVYITNTLTLMKAHPTTQYQEVDYHGTPCSSTQNYGEIIVSQLTVIGTSGINMGLFSQSLLNVRQVALVQ